MVVSTYFLTVILFGMFFLFSYRCLPGIRVDDGGKLLLMGIHKLGECVNLLAADVGGCFRQSIN